MTHLLFIWNAPFHDDVLSSDNSCSNYSDNKPGVVPNAWIVITSCEELLVHWCEWSDLGNYSNELIIVNSQSPFSRLIRHGIIPTQFPLVMKLLPESRKSINFSQLKVIKKWTKNFYSQHTLTLMFTFLLFLSLPLTLIRTTK